MAEIIDFLCEGGRKLADPNNAHVGPCIDCMAKVSLQPRKMVEFMVRNSSEYLNRKSPWELVEQNFPNPKALDEWVPHTDQSGRNGDQAVDVHRPEQARG